MMVNAIVRSAVVVLVGMLLAARPAGAASEVGKDIVIADFEGKDYGAWKVEGEAFGTGPAKGTLPKQMRVEGFKGKGLVNSFNPNDRGTGKLTSPAFVIQRKYINFLIGGGKNPGKTCINLLVEGKVVRTATGPNDKPGGSEQLNWAWWDVSELMGKSAVIEIVDQATGGWGHINVDQIVQSERKIVILMDQKREIVLQNKYLHLPVKTGGSKGKLSVSVGGQIVREIDIELAEGEPDFWAPMDVDVWKGKTATVTIDRMAEWSKGLASIDQSDAMKGMENAGKEKLRPGFHFSPLMGWNNDPNGLVYYKGEYHLYYQFNPYGWGWGNMHWGHAVSTDLVHWKYLPIAIYPARYGDWAFSGSAIVDKDNTAGFKNGSEDVIVAAYTSTGRGEVIVYSNDRGRTFSEYSGNPVVTHKGRDPKLIWYGPGKHWVMAVYDEVEKERYIAFYTSTDLKNWTFASRIEGFYECPEIVELAVDGKKDKTRWVLYAADGEYMIGSFDGKTFTKESGKHKYNFGNAFYASQAYNNIPAEDGRCIQIAWGRVKTPGMPFNQCMLFPVELTLRTTEEGVRMFARPVKEIERLHTRKHAWGKKTIKEGENLLAGVSGELLEIRAEFAVGNAKEFGFAVRDMAVTYNVEKQTVTCDKSTATLKPENGTVRLQILVDRTSIEVFGNDGRVYMPVSAVPAEDRKGVATFSKGGETTINALEVHELKSAWE